MLKAAERKFSEFLNIKKLKFTPQRRVILTEAFRAGGHFTAEELLDLSKKKHRGISKATLYRTLSLLTEGGLLEEQDFGDGRKYYERLLGHAHHDHLICVDCKKIFEFQSQEIEKIQEKIASRLGFDLLFHSHKLFGRCKRKNCSSHQ